MTNFTSGKSKIFVQAISYWELEEWRANSVDYSEAAHYQPSLLDQSSYFIFGVLSVNEDGVIVGLQGLYKVWEDHC